MNRAKEEGWIRIGMYDDVRRRSIWARRDYDDKGKLGRSNPIQGWVGR